MSTEHKKRFPFIATALGMLVAGSLAELAVQVYRRPQETLNSALRGMLLLAGVREETCDVGGLLMHYYCGGRRGTPMILIHGLGGSAENWALLLPLLSREYLVYAPDLPGFGKTPLAPEGTNIATHVLYIKRFLDTLGYPRVTLVGNSLGGWIATRFAVDYPERVERLYLLNSAGLQREHAKSPYAPDRAAALRSIQHMSGRRIPVPGFVLDAMTRNSQRPAYEGFIKGYDPREELDSVLAQVQAPTTIIWGTEDRLLPISCAHDFHRGIANSELMLLPHVGHVTQMQAPTKVARIILEHAQE